MRTDGRNRYGVDVAFTERGGLRDIVAACLPAPSEDFASLFHRLQATLCDLEAEMLEVRVLGAIEDYSDCQTALQKRFGRVDWPVTYVQGAGCLDNTIAGIQVRAVSGATVETVRVDGCPVGRIFEDDHARYCLLGDLRPPDGSTKAAQTQATLQVMEEGLARAGMDLGNVVRTWFFIDDILGWYGDFNRVRTKVYSTRGLFDRFVPASTGIGARNPHGAVVAACALALQAKGDSMVVRELPSPLQCSARDYGSSFSRAAEVTTPYARFVFVSGTASIDPEGRTVHAGDVDAQIARSLEVVTAILASRGMSLADVTRANAYFKYREDAAALGARYDGCGLPVDRTVISRHDICRDELLFEIEVDAVTGGTGSQPGKDAHYGTEPRGRTS